MITQEKIEELREAYRRHIENHLSGKHTYHWNELILDFGPSLLREIERLRRRLEEVEAQRDNAYEQCAKIADSHKGAADKEARKKGLYRNLRPEAYEEIRAEQRGEDIAAEIIARNIRALKGIV